MSYGNPMYGHYEPGPQHFPPNLPRPRRPPLAARPRSVSMITPGEYMGIQGGYLIMIIHVFSND